MRFSKSLMGLNIFVVHWYCDDIIAQNRGVRCAPRLIIKLILWLIRFRERRFVRKTSGKPRKNAPVGGVAGAVYLTCIYHDASARRLHGFLTNCRLRKMHCPAEDTVLLAVRAHNGPAHRRTLPPLPLRAAHLLRYPSGRPAGCRVSHRPTLEPGAANGMLCVGRAAIHRRPGSHRHQQRVWVGSRGCLVRAGADAAERCDLTRIDVWKSAYTYLLIHTYEFQVDHRSPAAQRKMQLECP